MIPTSGLFSGYSKTFPILIIMHFLCENKATCMKYEGDNKCQSINQLTHLSSSGLP